MVELVYQLYKNHHYIFEEIDMTEYLHELLLNNKNLIEQGDFENLYNNTRVGFRYELTQVLLASGIDPFIEARKIFHDAFNYPEAEVNYTLGSGITEIEESAFEGAELTSFTIPSTVKMIGKEHSGVVASQILSLRLEAKNLLLEYLHLKIVVVLKT